ncbi:MAG: hypothetical protein P4L99_26260 [Chthoniobacter sp.]|nr:hypothetical protein [Chthoniobacter sp.]
MKVIFLLFALLAGNALAATAVKVNFTLKTTDPQGAPLTQNRYYHVYRPDGFPRTTPLPMILLLEYGGNQGANSTFNIKAAQVGLVVVSCSFSGNSTGTPGRGWINGNPRESGLEDYDYLDAVINRVKASDNCDDVFISGLSKGGHTSLAYACERPAMIKAAASIDEFQSLTGNVIQAPVPLIVFEGTADGAVPYTKVKDTVDAWRAADGLANVAPVTTFEPSPLQPGKVTQTTWRGGTNGTQVAFVTLIGGTHAEPTPVIQTGYNIADGEWAFFSQYLTGKQAASKIVSPPVNNVQGSGQSASFWVAATGQPPLRYQWQRNGIDIPGANAIWYTTPATTAADNGAAYRAVVSNGLGSVTSNTATLTVIPAPSDPRITAPPASQQVTGGQPATFEVKASGTGALSYQWLKNGVPIVGATDASLHLPAAITADCGATFRAVVTNPAGSVMTEAATLTVLPAADAPRVTANPERVRTHPGEAATFSVEAQSKTPMSYQWQKGKVIGNMVDIPGATGATFLIPVTTLADHLTLIRCVVSNAAGSTPSASEFLFVTNPDAKPASAAKP